MALRFSSETEQELLARAVDSLPRVTKFPVAFGGLTTDGLLPVTATAGTRTRSLAGLVVQPERGLGGRSLGERRVPARAHCAARRRRAVPSMRCRRRA